MAELVHATALVAGTTGLLILGPSGSGKTSLALELIGAARAAGHFAALVSDDQVLIETQNGRLVGRAPETIAGLIEIRGSGIGRIEHVPEAVLHHAIGLVEVTSANRIPEPGQRWQGPGGMSLPLLPFESRSPAPFERLRAMIAGFPMAEPGRRATPFV